MFTQFLALSSSHTLHLWLQQKALWHTYQLQGASYTCSHSSSPFRVLVPCVFGCSRRHCDIHISYRVPHTHAHTVPRPSKFSYLASLAAVEGTVTYTSAFSEHKTVSSTVLSDGEVYEFLIVKVCGAPGGTVVKVPCYKSEGRWFDSIPAGVIGIFQWHKILLIALWPWGRLSL